MKVSQEERGGRRKGGRGRKSLVDNLTRGKRKMKRKSRYVIKEEEIRLGT